jgi:pseudouridine synthase
MLLTNDGQVALRLAHPRYQVQKEYQVTVGPRLGDRDAQAMVAGVALEDGPARFVGIELQAEEADRSRLLVTVQEGRNRLIRRVCEALGYQVLRLKRLRLGILALGKLAQGETRQLGAAEAENLRNSLGIGKPERKPRPERQRTGNSARPKAVRKMGQPGEAKRNFPDAKRRPPKG